MDDKKLYNKDSIESLSPLEFTRLRPGVYAGDTTYSTQLLVEIVSNAVDEFRLGHGDAIDILINNAGFGEFGFFTETNLDKEISLINTNITAVHILTKLFLQMYDYCV